MRTVLWSARAEQQLDAWIDYLAEVAGLELARDARDEAWAKAESLGGFAGYRRSLRWPGYQEVGLSHWHKLLVYKVFEDRVEISALFDMRQDLDRVRP